MKKILVFCFGYQPRESGAEIALREVVTRLTDYKFYVITYRFSKDDLEFENDGRVFIYRILLGDGRENVFLWEKIKYIFYAVQLARKLYLEEGFMVIWGIMASYAGIAGWIFKKINPQVKFLLTLQEGDSENHLTYGHWGLNGIFFKLVNRGADYIQVISQYLKNYSRKIGSTAPIVVISNGIDYDFFHQKYSIVEKNTLRKKIGLEDEKVLITTSRLNVKNGIDLVIRAIAQLKSMGADNIKFLILGYGEDEGQLRKLAEDLGVLEACLFLGRITQGEIPLYLNIADIFIRPSRSEGLGNSFLEAMAAMRPIIATRVGGIPDFLTDEETGFFVETEDFREIVKRLIYLFKNPEKVDIVRRRASDLVREKYTWDYLSQEFKRLFEIILKK